MQKQRNYIPRFLQLKRDCGSIGLLCFSESGDDGGAHFLLDTELTHDQFDLLYLVFVTRALSDCATRVIITADDLLIRSLICRLVIENTVACHIDAHIRGALIGGGSVNFFEHDLENREDRNKKNTPRFFRGV